VEYAPAIHTSAHLYGDGGPNFLAVCSSHQGLDGGGAQGGNPVEASGTEILADTRLGDHAAVADQHHVLEAEALLELGDLGGQRGGIAGVALEHLDGDRAAVRGAEQAVGDLQLARLAVAAVAARGPRSAAALQGA